MNGTTTYIDYPRDLGWMPTRFAAEWQAADVIHAMEKVANLQAWFDPLAKPLVLHHHGTALRNHPELAAWAAERAIPQVCSTIDLTAIHPAIAWLPNPMATDWFAGFRSQYHPADDQPFTVSHTPTWRALKATDELIAAAAQAHVRLELAEGVNWVSALVAKARSHAYFDQTLFGFGLSATEAWSMGLPVMAGASPEILALMARTWGFLPFVDVAERGLVGTILTLAERGSLYRDAAGLGHEFVLTYHDERRVVERLKDLWTRTRDEWQPGRV